MNEPSGVEKGVTLAAFGEKSVMRPGRELVRFSVERDGSTCLLHVDGEVDASNSAALETAIAGTARNGCGLVIVSFAGCKFVDFSCALVLIRQFKTLAGRFSIVAPPAGRLRRLLDVTSLTGSLPVYNNVRQAQLAGASRSHAALGTLPKWKSPATRRARLEEIVFLLGGSPRFLGGVPKVSISEAFDDSDECLASPRGDTLL